MNSVLELTDHRVWQLTLPVPPTIVDWHGRINRDPRSEWAAHTICTIYMIIKTKQMFFWQRSEIQAKIAQPCFGKEAEVYKPVGSHLRNTQCIYTRISIQVTVDHAERQGEIGAWGVTTSSQCFGKSCILDHPCIWWSPSPHWMNL